MLNALLRTFGFFDFNGLKYSIDHLNSIQREIVFYPIEQQAKYVDSVTKSEIDNQNEAFIILQLGDIGAKSTHLFGNLNATAVGNIAYVALYGCIPSISKNCKDFLEAYRKHLTNFR